MVRTTRMAEKVERCPWCGSTISHDKFVRIQEAIREEERRKLAAAVDLVKAEVEKQRKKEIAEVRRILQKDRDAALAKREAEFARERDALQKKIVDISRRVGKGGELADGSEIDLYDELRGAFPEDPLSRRGSGNLLLDVQYKKKSAGKLLIAAKPRAAWQQAFVTKLRQEQSGEALQIDVDEKRSHDLVWRKRGTVLTRIRQVLRDIDSDVSAIVESRDETQGGKIAAFRVTR